MKKFGVFILIAFAALFVCVITGCPNDDKTESMTFVDDRADPAKEFTISSDYKFKVKFLKVGSVLETTAGIKSGDSVSGKIKDASASWNKSLTGTAAKMSSTNDTIDGNVDGLVIAIWLTYADGNDNVTLAFPDPNGVSPIAQDLMGRTYYRKN